MRPRRPTRHRTFSYLGTHRYFLTFCAAGRVALFQNGDLVSEVLFEIRRACKVQEFALLAYCFMPDHLHLLVEACAGHSDLRRFVKLWRQRTGMAYSQASRGRRLWQAGYYDHVLRHPERPEVIARYIWENPVRAGLVSSPEEYPFNGSDLGDMRDILQTWQSGRRRD